MELRVCRTYGARQLGLREPTDSFVQFISKLDRKHCRMLLGFLTRHVNLQYMLHKMRRAKTPLCRRYGVEKGTSAHSLSECVALEKIRIHTYGFTMDSEKVQETRMRTIVDRGKESELLNSPL